MENLDPPPPSPISRMGKWRFFALRAASSLIWWEWGFAVPFYFAQDCSFKRRFSFGKFPGVNVLRFLPKYMFEIFFSYEI